MTEVSIGLAFAAGLISFVSPCVLALLPVYLAFLGDAAVADDPGATLGTGTGSLAAAAPARTAVLGQALLFVLGFASVFVVVFTALAVLGGPLFNVPEIRQLAGVVIVGIGILTTGAFGPVLDRFSIGVDPANLPAARSARSLALGAFVAVGWTPCIGPVLGTIFAAGASSGSAPAVAVLLAAYSAGLAIPFIAAALALPRLRPVLDALRRHHRLVQFVAGGLIVVIGVMIFFNAFGRLAGMFTFVL